MNVTSLDGWSWQAPPTCPPISTNGIVSGGRYHDRFGTGYRWVDAAATTTSTAAA